MAFSAVNDSGSSVFRQSYMEAYVFGLSWQQLSSRIALCGKVWRDTTDTYNGFIYLHRADVDFKVKLQ